MLSALQEYDVADLVTELGDLEFSEKSNDLYKFRQSADLATAKGMPRVRAFRDLMRTQVGTGVGIHNAVMIAYFNTTLLGKDVTA